MPDPSNASLGEALDHLRANFSGMIDELVEGRLAIWAGSMLSGARFPPLKELLEKLLNDLHSEIDHTNPNCPYLKAIEEIFAVGQVPDDDRGDMKKRPSRWGKRKGEEKISRIANRLASRYSQVLDVKVQTSPVKSLVWDVLKLPKIYADPTKQPDAEHRLISLLILERVVEEIVSTNWDELIERAFQATQPPSSSVGLHCVVHPRDIARDLRRDRRLSKIHGCARRAIESPAEHEPLFIATESDIRRWLKKLPEQQTIRSHLEAILRERPMVFIGSSGQDFNLQLIFDEVGSQIGGFPIDPPRFRFSSAKFEIPHRKVLESVYGDGFQQSHFEAVSVLSLYAKPLLGAFYVLTLLKKAEAIADVGKDDLNVFGFDWHQVLLSGIGAFEQRIRQWFESLPATDPAERWRELAVELPAAITRFWLMYESLQLPVTNLEYREVWNEHVRDIRNGRHSVSVKRHFVLLTLATLVVGEQKGLWVIESPTSSDFKAGQFTLRMKKAQVTVFCLQSGSSTRCKIEKLGLTPATALPQTLKLYPTGDKPPLSKRRPSSPAVASRLPTRSKKKGTSPIAEIWMEQEFEKAKGIDDLLKKLVKGMPS